MITVKSVLLLYKVRNEKCSYHQQTLSIKKLYCNYHAQHPKHTDI